MRTVGSPSQTRQNEDLNGTKAVASFLSKPRCGFFSPSAVSLHPVFVWIELSSWGLLFPDRDQLEEKVAPISPS